MFGVAEIQINIQNDLCVKKLLPFDRLFFEKNVLCLRKYVYFYTLKISDHAKHANLSGSKIDKLFDSIVDSK
jgi:hypothetical protein